MIIGAAVASAQPPPAAAPVSPSPPPAVPAPAPRGRTDDETRNLDLIIKFHNTGTSIQKLRDSGLLSEEVEWWVAGSQDVLPFAGTWRGLDGVAEFQRHLRETMKYEKTELQEYIVDGDQVAAIFKGIGHAVKTGRPFESLILRLYTLRSGKIIRVRNFFDTAAYAAAVK